MSTARKSYNLGEKTQQYLNDLCEALDQNETAVVKMAIQEKHAEWAKQQFGYRGAAVAMNTIQKTTKKEALENHKKEMLAMSDASLIVHLVELGYIVSPEKISSTIVKRWEIYSNPETKERFLVEKHRDTVTDTDCYTRFAMTMDEMFADMKKEGKL